MKNKFLLFVCIILISNGCETNKKNKMIESNLTKETFNDYSVETFRSKIPSYINNQEIQEALKNKFISPNKHAFIITFLLKRKSLNYICFKMNGKYQIIDISNVEYINLGKLGIKKDNNYQKVETKPIKWLDDNKKFHIEMETKAYDSQKYTISEQLIIKKDTTIIWR